MSRANRFGGNNSLRQLYKSPSIFYEASVSTLKWTFTTRNIQYTKPSHPIKEMATCLTVEGTGVRYDVTRRRQDEKRLQPDRILIMTNCVSGIPVNR
jgi:hypothetical protein